MIRLQCGDDVREVELRGQAEGPRVEVDGAAFQPSVERVGPGAFVLHQGERHQAFYCVREGATIHLFWQGTAYRMEELSESDRALHRHVAHGLEAPMPGKVIAVKVEPGQQVSRGDELVVVEAMKMENAIRAPRDGVVKLVAARVGDMVGPGRVLVELS